MFENIKIASAIGEASKVIKMDDNKAFDSLKAILMSQGMDTNVEFTPQEGLKVNIQTPTPLVFNGILLTLVASVLAGEYYYVPTLKEYVINNIDNKVYIDVELENNFGVKEVQVINNGEVIVGEYKDGKYSFLLENNGDYTINIINNSGKVTSDEIVVNQIDDIGPVIESYEVIGNTYKFIYSDVSELDLSSAYALADGKKLIPKINGNTVIYEYEGDAFKVYIGDKLGNVSEYLVEK